MRTLIGLALCLLMTTTHAQTVNDLTREQAEALAQLPLACIQTEFPNKLGQTLSSPEDLGTPRGLHPAFYGCFDWHSAVHGHWSLVRLLRLFPDLDAADTARGMLQQNINAGTIAGELAYFQRATEGTYERTYGWAWLFKLQQELDGWDDPLGRQMASDLAPLTALLTERLQNYLPRLQYPIRIGEHTNTAFGLAFAWDYAVAANLDELRLAIESRARDFFLADQACPMQWEPSGYDFLSPCLAEADLMRRILPAAEFESWIAAFLPALRAADFSLAPGIVGDRSDGHLVHLDGLNFSRAWTFYGLARQYPRFAHLRSVADAHISHSLPSLFGDGYEGGHWLGSFAIYALGER